jgi:hypothetical protein
MPRNSIFFTEITAIFRIRRDFFVDFGFLDQDMRDADAPGDLYRAVNFGFGEHRRDHGHREGPRSQSRKGRMAQERTVHASGKGYRPGARPSDKGQKLLIFLVQPGR